MSTNSETIDVKVTKVAGMVRYSVTCEVLYPLQVWSRDLEKRYEWLAYNTDVSEPVFKPNIGLWCLYASRYISAGG